MNSFVSMIAGGSKAVPPPATPDLAAPSSEPKTSFSSVLERTLQRPAERPAVQAKPNRSRSERPDVAREDSSPAESRVPAREEKKRKEEGTDQSLAGACAVPGQPLQPDEPARVEPATEEMPTEAGQSAAGTTTGEGASTKAVGGAEGKISTVSPETRALLEIDAIQTTSVPPPEGEELISMLTPVESSESQSAVATATTVTADATTATVATTITPADQPVIGAELSLTAELNAIVERELSGAVENVAPEFPRTSPVTSAREVEAQQVNSAAVGEVVEPPPESIPAQMEKVAAAVPMASEEVRRTVRAARLFRAETMENDRGIAGAQPMSTMKTSLRKEEIAGATGQLLPGSATAVSLVTNLPGETRRNTGGTISSETVLEAGRLTPAPVRADISETSQPIEARTTSPLVRVSELISREVRMFKRGGDELVEVVLTPDVKTQISLRLQWREGQVEVQARCDFGDYRTLNTEWAQLQSSLATHGVRLSHLSERTPTGFTDFFNHPNFSQRQGSEQQKGGEARPPENLASVPPVSGKSAATTAAPRSNRLFDFWA